METRLRATPDHLTPQRRRLVLLAMCAATFMTQLDNTIVTVALPAIQHDLDASPLTLSWVPNAYALSVAAALPVAGVLGDRYGKKPVFLLGMVLFALSSIACAIAPDSATLITARAAQGIGGAAMLALSLSILTTTFPPRHRAAAIGTWAAIGGTGFGLGPVIGGLLLSSEPWPTIFWVNAPLAALGILATAKAVPTSRTTTYRSLDGTGVALLTAAMALLTLGIINTGNASITSSSVATPLSLGIGLLAMFVGWEVRTSHPMIPTGLYRARSFTTASLVYVLTYAAFSGSIFYVTLRYQNLYGWSPLRTGLSWLFMNVPFLCTAQAAGRLARLLPPTAIVGTGCLLASAGFVLLAQTDTPFTITAVGFALAGSGYGVIAPGITHLAMRDVPATITGTASGLLNTARQLGTALGLALTGAIATHAITTAWIASATVDQHPTALRNTTTWVASGRIDKVTHALGPDARSTAIGAFTDGYHLALWLGASIAALAAAVALAGFSTIAGRRTPQPTSTSSTS